MRCPLKGEADVDKRSYSLHAGIMLCMVKEVLLAALIGGMPFEDIEMTAAQRR